MSKKLGLVLEGGGVKGAYQDGVLKAINEIGVDFDGIAGTSIGALNGAFILQGGYENLFNIWDEITTSTIFDIDDEMISKYKKKDFDLNMFVYVGKKFAALREVLRDSYEQSQEFFTSIVDESVLRASKKDFGLVTYNLTDMKPVELMKEEIPEGKMVDYIIASATFPIFPAKIIDDKKYIDGGVYDNMPINLLARNGYDKMLVIRTNVASKQPKRKVERDDLDLRYVVPRKDLGLAMSFSDDKIRELRAIGYEDGKIALENGLEEFLLS